MSSNSLTKKNNLFFDIIKGALVSVSATLILILLFAVLIRFLNIPDSFIFPINQVIKLISLIFGLVIALKKNNEKGFVKGLLLGLTYFVLSFFVFSILQGNINFSMKNFYDLLLTTLASGLIGIIVVNIKK